MNSYQFFLKHAGYSWDPKTQTPMQGRIQCARRLAAAERKARDAGISYQWELNPLESSAEWCEDNEDGGRNCNPYSTWVCRAIGYCGSPDDTETCEDREYKCCENPRIVASLGGIDFGRDGEPWGNPYRRVVEAELALEALEQLERA